MKRPEKRRSVGLAAGLLFVALLAGCTTAEMKDDSAFGQPTLCTGGARDLGAVEVYPRTSWHPDQKDLEARASLAERGIKSAFAALPCGHVAVVHQLDEPRDWHEVDARRSARKAGADTLILLQVRELGPHQELSAAARSAPGDVSLHLRAIDLKSGETLLDAERSQTAGASSGAGGAGGLDQAMAAALRGFIGS